MKSDPLFNNSLSLNSEHSHILTPFSILFDRYIFDIANKKEE